MKMKLATNSLLAALVILPSTAFAATGAASSSKASVVTSTNSSGNQTEGGLFDKSGGADLVSFDVFFSISNTIHNPPSGGDGGGKTTVGQVNAKLQPMPIGGASPSLFSPALFPSLTLSGVLGASSLQYPRVKSSENVNRSEVDASTYALTNTQAYSCAEFTRQEYQFLPVFPRPVSNEVAGFTPFAMRYIDPSVGIVVSNHTTVSSVASDGAAVGFFLRAYDLTTQAFLRTPNGQLYMLNDGGPEHVGATALTIARAPSGAYVIGGSRCADLSSRCDPLAGTMQDFAVKPIVWTWTSTATDPVPVEITSPAGCGSGNPVYGEVSGLNESGTVASASLRCASYGYRAAVVNLSQPSAPTILPGQCLFASTASANCTQYSATLTGEGSPICPGGACGMLSGSSSNGKIYHQSFARGISGDGLRIVGDAYFRTNNTTTPPTWTGEGNSFTAGLAWNGTSDGGFSALPTILFNRRYGTPFGRQEAEFSVPGVNQADTTRSNALNVVRIGAVSPNGSIVAGEWSRGRFADTAATAGLVRRWCDLDTNAPVAGVTPGQLVQPYTTASCWVTQSQPKGTRYDSVQEGFVSSLSGGDPNQSSIGLDDVSDGLAANPDPLAATNPSLVYSQNSFYSSVADVSLGGRYYGRGFERASTVDLGYGIPTYHLTGYVWNDQRVGERQTVPQFFHRRRIELGDVWHVIDVRSASNSGSWFGGMARCKQVPDSSANGGLTTPAYVGYLANARDYLSDGSSNLCGN